MTTDSVNHPQHYIHPSGVECIQITEHLNFCLGNAVKYIWRADHKGDDINDLRKAIWYLEREITRRTDEVTTAPLVAKSDPSPTEEDDPGASIAEIRLQAVGGDRHAQLYLAQGYAHGWYGLIQSSYMSSLWRSRANEPQTEPADVATVIADPLADMRARAEAGDRHAQCTLGDAYAHGMEVAQDRVESDRWYALANAARTTEGAQ